MWPRKEFPSIPYGTLIRLLKLRDELCRNIWRMWVCHLMTNDVRVTIERRVEIPFSMMTIIVLTNFGVNIMKSSRRSHTLVLRSNGNGVFKLTWPGFIKYLGIDRHGRELSAKITQSERDIAVSRLEVYRKWFLKDVMRVGQFDTLVILPIENISPRYRDELPAWWPPTSIT